MICCCRYCLRRDEGSKRRKMVLINILKRCRVRSDFSAFCKWKFKTRKWCASREKLSLSCLREKILSYDKQRRALIFISNLEIRKIKLSLTLAYLICEMKTYSMIVFDAPIILSLLLWIHSIPYFCEFVTICRLFHLSALCNCNPTLTENQPHRNQQRLPLIGVLYYNHAPLGNC